MNDRLIIIGAGGHGKVCADIASKMKLWKNIEFIEDNPTVLSFAQFKVVGKVSHFTNYIHDSDFFIALGNNKLRMKIFKELLNREANITTLIHPSSTIGLDVLIGIGTVVMPGVVINCCTTIGDGCIINTSSSIDHDNIIGNFVHVSPGARLAGTVEVRDFTWIGAGAVVKNNLMITNDCIIGAGGVVLKHITNSGMYFGVPARSKQ